MVLTKTQKHPELALHLQNFSCLRIRTSTLLTFLATSLVAQKMTGVNLSLPILYTIDGRILANRIITLAKKNGSICCDKLEDC